MASYDVFARFYDLCFGDTVDDLFMIQQFAERCGSPILELGCGTGRVLLPLARQGYQITGVDVSPGMLEVARRKVAAENLVGRATLVEGDIRELDLDAGFNFAFIAVNSFMHLLSTDDQLAALARIRQHLNPGGLFLLDLFNPDLVRLLDMKGQMALDEAMTDPDTGHQLMRFHADKADLGRQQIHVTFIVDEMDEKGQVRRVVFPFEIRYLFHYELELLLRQAGFEIEAIYGSYDLDEYTGDSAKMIAVARRPA
jgi:SAM-dependent methyltransferase